MLKNIAKRAVKALQVENGWKLVSPKTIRMADGQPYMKRLILFRTPFGGLMINHFIGGDESRCHHDHPWPFISIMVKGGYREFVPTGHGEAESEHHAPCILFRPAKHTHRVEMLEPGGQCLTICITGPSERDWGFITKKGWLYWREYLAQTEGNPDGERDLCG
ncbi:MAG: hypothetical protein KDB07_00365 [Planctomycetes bacterium]|nr:hypothetical protein [Planctomycetota bacterium]